MSYDASTEKIVFAGFEDIPEITFEKVLTFTYLGIPLSVSPYCLFRKFTDKVKEKAKNYMYSELSLVRNGPDRSELAKTLWLNCAIPSILYGCEIIPIDSNTIQEIEKCQATIGKFILQIPKNSANVCANLDAGLKPIKSIIDEKVLLYNKKIMEKPVDSWSKQAYMELLNMGDKSPYMKNLNKIKESYMSFGKSRKEIKLKIDQTAVRHVLEQKRKVCTSMFSTTTPFISKRYSWFKTKSWVDDSETCKIFNEFRCCNAGLGNSGPTKDGRFSKLCFLCKNEGRIAINNEVSV